MPAPRFSKLCGRVGCRELVIGRGPKTLAQREFCSVSCAVRQRIETGTWHYPVLSDAARRRGGSVGGRRSAEVRRALAMQRQAAALAEKLTPDMLAVLTARQVALIRVLLVHAWRRGRKTGYSMGINAKRAVRKDVAA